MYTAYTTTKLTQEWDLGPQKRTRSMKNRKPYRTPARKAEAQKKARRSKDGAYRCSVPVSFHP